MADSTTSTTIGYEAFSRPSSIFQHKNKNKLVAVDLLSFGLATEKARQVFNGNKKFINIRPGTLIWLFKTKQQIYLPETKNLVLELTEQENENPEQVFHAVNWIQRQLKCEIAIDDITSGYNRIRYISDLQPKYLKIDRPLIHGCYNNKRKRQTIKAIIRFAETLGALLIAEGIEKEEEKSTLLELGVPLGQGYLFGKPRSYEA